MTFLKITPEIRINKNLINKSELARALNVTPCYVSMIINNKRKAPAIRNKIKALIAQEYLKVENNLTNKTSTKKEQTMNEQQEQKQLIAEKIRDNINALQELIGAANSIGLSVTVRTMPSFTSIQAGERKDVVHISINENISY